jgi:hypothetical protein
VGTEASGVTEAPVRLMRSLASLADAKTGPLRACDPAAVVLVDVTPKREFGEWEREKLLRGNRTAWGSGVAC